MIHSLQIHQTQYTMPPWLASSVEYVNNQFVHLK